MNDGLVPERLVWGSPQWQFPAVIAGCVAVLLIALSYRAARGPRWVRLTAAGLKGLALAALLACLLEPMLETERPRPGANVFVVLADTSRSLTLRDGSGRTPADDHVAALGRADWQARLGEDYDLRRYVFDSRLRSVASFEQLEHDGESSSLGSALRALAERFRGRPLAGVLLLSDGNATDDVAAAVAQWRADELPPIHVVQPAERRPAADVSIRRVTVRQTVFEAAPVTVAAEIQAEGIEAPLLVELLDESGRRIDHRTIEQPEPGRPAAIELRVAPDAAGLHVYRLRAGLASELAELSARDSAPPSPESTRQTAEATLENNERVLVVHRRGGPYRVLYVAGRPNWEFKFLRRACEGDDELDLVGLLRVAHKEAKFQFRDRDAGSTNPLFQGFDPSDPDAVENYDQPVLIRIGVEDQQELRDGFPQDPHELFEYQAVVLDDLEAPFFKQDQMSLLQEFVSRRGGGLLMLGGQASFGSGGYGRTAIGELLPVYVDDSPASQAPRFRLDPTREGWLQAWTRLRTTEAEEHQRLLTMPWFGTLNRSRRIKPGAVVLATAAATDGGEPLPALVEQRFGAGRAAALLVGDYWRWAMARPADQPRDLETAWRQLLRWLVSDVPTRVEAEAKPTEEGETRIEVQVRDEAYAPLDNAEVRVEVTLPDGRRIEQLAREGAKPGVYETTFGSREAGAYRAQITARAPDASPIGEALAGWASSPSAEEFAALTPNTGLLRDLAQATDGDSPTLNGLDDWAVGLSRRKAPISEPRLEPLWQRWGFFLLATLLLAGEWGLRRWNGMP